MDANNGNWQTAQRWASMLSAAHQVELAKSWDGLSATLAHYDAMIALHARRSAPSVAAFANVCPAKPLIVVLTGTDLYHDIAHDAHAKQSLQLASRLVVLQAQGVYDLPVPLQEKTVVVFQSSPKLAKFAKQSPLSPSSDAQTLKIAVVGHLRAEKSPETTFAVAQQLALQGLAMRITHVGKALTQGGQVQAQRTEQDYPAHYQWLGGLSHADSLAMIANSDVLLHPSAMEGGALAIIEAVQAGIPLIASRVSGHIGLLGNDYEGLFDWANVDQAVFLLRLLACKPAFKQRLLAQCQARSHLFSPQTEQSQLLNLLG